MYQGSLFVGSRDGNVYAVRGENRDVLWPGLDKGFFKTGGPILADVAVDKDGVYVASMDSKLYCLDINTGRVRWIYYAGTPLRENSDPVATASYVYVYAPGTGIAAIDKAGKQEIRPAKWTVPQARQFLAADEKFVYLRTDDNLIIGVDKMNGQVKMTSQRRDLAVFAINTSTKDTNVYAGTANGQVYSIKPVLKPGTIGEFVFEYNRVDALALR